MQRTLEIALEKYFQQWETFCADCDNPAYFKQLQPTAVGWKVADAEEYARRYAKLREHCEKTIETRMNGRWIAKMILKDGLSPRGIRILKIMERRPGSTDATGLDHVDFLAVDAAGIEQALAGEPKVRWTREQNDAIEGYTWLSVWFADTEAKIKPYTVIDTCMQELEVINRSMRVNAGK